MEVQVCHWLPNAWIFSAMLVTGGCKVVLAAMAVAWCFYGGEMENVHR